MQTSNFNHNNDEINLKEIFDVLWSGKKIIFLITSFFAIGSVIFALSLHNFYKSESLLKPRMSSDVSGLSQYSGIAAMAGINIPSSGENKSDQIVELIKSRNFVRHLLEFEDILPALLAPKSYDSFSKKLVFDDKTYNAETSTWVREPKKNRPIIPTYLEAHEAYKDMLSVSVDKVTGFINISFEHISPIFAQEFLYLIINESNDLIRKQEMLESKNGIEYLTNELTKTSYIELQESINSLIEIQLETQMMTNINEDYVLVFIDPPFIPEEKSRPTRSIICILITIFGGFLSCCVVLIRNYFFSINKNSE